MDGVLCQSVLLLFYVFEFVLLLIIGSKKYQLVMKIHYIYMGWFVLV